MAAPEQQRPPRPDRRREPGAGWAWFDATPGRGGPAGPDRDVCRSFLACFAGVEGEAALGHLRRVFLDRRLPPSATDAELRHVEGQRSVVAYVLAMLERAGAARDPHEDRF